MLIFYCTFHEILLLLIVKGGAINFDALHQLLYLYYLEVARQFVWCTNWLVNIYHLFMANTYISWPHKLTAISPKSVVMWNWNVEKSSWCINWCFNSYHSFVRNEIYHWQCCLVIYFSIQCKLEKNFSNFLFIVPYSLHLPLHKWLGNMPSVVAVV